MYDSTRFLESALFHPFALTETEICPTLRKPWITDGGSFSRIRDPPKRVTKCKSFNPRRREPSAMYDAKKCLGASREIEDRMKRVSFLLEE